MPFMWLILLCSTTYSKLDKNTYCWCVHPSLEANVTRLGIKIQDDDDDNCFYIALVSALEQTHCAFVGCGSE